jgi:hypothetical protein
MFEILSVCVTHITLGHRLVYFRFRNEEVEVEASTMPRLIIEVMIWYKLFRFR